MPPGGRRYSLPTPVETVAIWRDLEFILKTGAPLPDDTKEYLVEVSRRLGVLVIDRQRAPEEAAKLVAAALGLEGRVIRAWRDANKADIFGVQFELERRDTTDKVENLADDFASMAGVSRRTIFRWGKRAAKRIDKMISARRSAAENRS